jgi:HPt (histidine-containing phosphotransfer) domain-containing protein
MLYDLTELRSYSNGDKDFELDMFQTFLDQTSEFLTQLDGFMLHNNTLEVGKVAHKFKSSVGIFGMESIRKNLELLENACRIHAERESVEAIYETVKEQVLQVIPQIEAEKLICLE